MNFKAPSRCVILFAVEADDRSRQVQLLALADRLNRDGVDTEISLYHSSPPEGWNVWMEQMAVNRVALVACTELYRDRFEVHDTSGSGGVIYEARILRERLKAGKGLNSDVIPFVLGPTDRTFIPRVLQDVTAYDVSNEEGYEALYARLTGREMYEKPPLGEIRPLRVRDVDASTSKESIPSTDHAAIRAEIAVALERLLSGLRRTFIRGQFSFGEWQYLHDDLDARVRNRGSRALGRLYADFCRALDHDQFAITYGTRLYEKYAPRFEQAKSNDEKLGSLTRAHDAYAMQNIASAVQTLTPFLRELGNDELATRLEYVATSQREIAERDLGDPRLET